MRLNKEKVIKICDQVVSWSIYISLALVPVWFAFWQENFSVFELNKLVIFKTALSLAWLAVLIKICITRQLKIFTNWKIFLPLGILAVYILVNTLISINPRQSFFGVYMRQQGVHSFIYYWLWFSLLLLHWRNIKQVKRSFLFAGIGLLLVIFYSFIQKLGLDPFNWAFSGADRTFANLGQPNFLAYYIAITIFLTAGAWLWCKKYWQKIALGVLILLQCLIINFTISRGGFLGVLAGVLIIIGFRLWQVKRRKLVIILISVFAIVTISSGLVINTFVDQGKITNRTIVRQISAFKVTPGSSQIRIYYWQSAWQELQKASWDRKLFGYGKDSQRNIFGQYYRPNWGNHEAINSYPDRAHNIIIDIWLEFGLVGLLLFGWFNGVIIVRAIRAWSKESHFAEATRDKHKIPLLRGVAGGRGMSGVTDHHLKNSFGEVDNIPRLSNESHPSQEGNYKLIPYLLAGVGAYFVSNLFGFPLTTHYVYYYFILSLLWWLGSDTDEKIINFKASKLFLWLVLASLTIFNAFILWQFTYKYFIADTYFMKSEVGVAKVDCQMTINNVNQALRWQPLDLYYQERSIFNYNNCLPIIKPKSAQKEVMESLLAQLELVADDNYNYDFNLNIARSYSLFGFYFDKKYYIEADEYYQKVIKINPSLLIAYQDYGRMKMWAGDYEEAKKIFEKGISYSPMYATGYLDTGVAGSIESTTYSMLQYIGNCDYHAKKFKEALRVYQQIEKTNIGKSGLYKDMADAYYQLKDYKSTEIYLKKAVSEDTTDLDANLKLASFFAERGNLKDAKIIAQAVLKAFPDNEEALKIMENIEKR